MAETCQFFSAEAKAQHNLSALTKQSLEEFLVTLPNMRDVLAKVKDKTGYFQDRTFQATSLLEVLLGLGFNVEQSLLQLTPQHLISMPLNLVFNKTLKDLTIADIELVDLVQIYIASVSAVFNNDLAQRPYDPKAQQIQENVSEQQHAQQAAVIIGHLSQENKNRNVTVMLLHDIARATTASTQDGDLYHHLEGTVIGKPLGFSADPIAEFCLYHGFAKFIWSLCSEKYNQTLLSAWSKMSLGVQTTHLKPLLEQLDDKTHYTDQQLQTLFAAILLQRLVDEASKVPQEKEATLLKGSEVTALITEQLVNYANCFCVDVEKTTVYKNMLREALKILQRYAPQAVLER
jgi:hypothetical protein